MKQHTTIQFGNSRAVYSWGTIFMLLSLAKVDPFLPEIHFPFRSKPKELTDIAKRFFEEFYNIILWGAGHELSTPAKELFEVTNQKLVLAMGTENASVFCEWGNGLPIEEARTDTVLQLWNDLILPNYHRGNLINIFGEELVDKNNLMQQSIATAYKDLVQIDDKIDSLKHAPSDEWEKHVIYLYNRGEPGNKDVEIVIYPFTELWRLLYFLRIETFLNTLKNTLSLQELDMWSRVIQSYITPRHVQINVKDLLTSL